MTIKLILQSLTILKALSAHKVAIIDPFLRSEASEQVVALYDMNLVQQYQFGCKILKMVGPIKQDFWLTINILKGNHCILRIRGAPLRQKLGMILEN